MEEVLQEFECVFSSGGHGLVCHTQQVHNLVHKRIRIGTVGPRDPGQNLINKSDGVRKTEMLPTG